MGYLAKYADNNNADIIIFTWTFNHSNIHNPRFVFSQIHLSFMFYHLPLNVWTLPCAATPCDSDI